MNTNLLREDLEELLKENDANLKSKLKELTSQYIYSWKYDLIEELFHDGGINFETLVNRLIEEKLLDKHSIEYWIKHNISVDTEVYFDRPY